VVAASPHGQRSRLVCVKPASSSAPSDAWLDAEPGPNRQNRGHPHPRARVPSAPRSHSGGRGRSAGRAAPDDRGIDRSHPVLVWCVFATQDLTAALPHPRARVPSGGRSPSGCRLGRDRGDDRQRAKVLQRGNYDELLLAAPLAVQVLDAVAGEERPSVERPVAHVGAKSEYL
jgi:hypothetical protein